MKCNITPLEGENLIAEIAGEMWAASSNPIVRFFAFIDKILCFIFGFRKAGYLVLTDRRIIFIRKRVALWCFPLEAIIKSYLPQGISAVGYTRKGTCLGCFCPMFCLELTSISGEVITIQLKGATEKMAASYANTMYEAIRS